MHPRSSIEIQISMHPSMHPSVHPSIHSFPPSQVHEIKDKYLTLPIDARVSHIRKYVALALACHSSRGSPPLSLSLSLFDAQFVSTNDIMNNYALRRGIF
jgi:hypothetical protein